MARGTRQIEHQPDDEAPVIDAGYEDVSGLVDAQEEMENSINAEIGSPDGDVRWKIKVYRVEANGKDIAFLFDIIGESIEGLAARLRDEYGTGKYMARVYKNSKLHKAPVFKVEAPKNHAPVAAPDHGGSALVQSVAQNGAILQTVVQELVALKRAPAVAAPAVDSVGMIASMAAIMKEMRGFMPEPPPPPKPVDPMAVLNSAIEMAKSLSDNDRPKSMIEVVGEFMQSDLMKTVVQNAQAQQSQQPAQLPPPRQRPQIQQRPPGQPPAPNAAPAATPPAAPPPQAGEAEFSALLTMLITRAANNSDPALYADLVEDMVDRQSLEGLLAIPNPPGPLGMLIQYNPAVATYRGWFSSLIEALTEPTDGVDNDGALDDTADTSAQGSERASGNGPAPIPAAVTS